MRSHQRGVTLISLMVGLVISMIALLGVLTVYKNAIRNVFGSAGMVSSAAQDGQLSSGLLTAQMVLQDAGFGIGAAAAASSSSAASASTGTSTAATSANNLTLLSSATFDGGSQQLSGTVNAISTTASAGNVLLWESNPNPASASASYTCMGLFSDSATNALYLLKATNACHPIASSWNNVTWSKSTLIAAGSLAQAVSFSVKNGMTCWPFGAIPKTISGIEPPSAAVQATLSYTNSTVGSSNSYAICLSNFSS
jgi:Tfp pilus assembly protein PilW